MALHLVVLNGAADWIGFRREARALLAKGMAPEQVSWHADDDPCEDLFAQQVPRTVVAESPSPPASANQVPPAFIALCETVVMHSDPARFGLLYRLLWRLVHEPALRHDPIDADRVRAQHMAQQVRRDMHKMKAFVRFRELPQDDGKPLHVAWFEPSHHVVDATAPFFMRRFTQMRWAILTPRRSVRWMGEALEFGPGARREDAPPADAGESLWLTYYRSIFNPARLKLSMMRKEMPRKYWHNLPEASLIGMLSAQARTRTGQMIEADASVPQRRIPIRHATARFESVGGWPQDSRKPFDKLRANGGDKANRDDANADRASADANEQLALLRRAADRCRECPIGQHATQAVCGEGPAGAALMVVGEQPGDQEDLRGRPFVGPAGQLFDRAMAQLGWPREKLYITNAVKHFKYELRGKRRIHKTAGQREAAACLHWLESEMDLVQPQALIALGATAARALLGREVAVTRERGQWHVDARGRKVLVTLHPSALLRGDPLTQDADFNRWVADLSQASAVMEPTSAAPSLLILDQAL